MNQIARTVVDTSVALSGLLFPSSIPAKALIKAQAGIVLASEAMCKELLSVFARPRFDRYGTKEHRLQLASAVIRATEVVLSPHPSASAATRATTNSLKPLHMAAPMQSSLAISICWRLIPSTASAFLRRLPSWTRKQSEPLPTMHPARYSLNDAAFFTSALL
jgi:hypothetical protein